MYVVAFGRKYLSQRVRSSVKRSGRMNKRRHNEPSSVIRSFLAGDDARTQPQVDQCIHYPERIHVAA